MDAIFLKIVNMSIAASWLILAVILLRVVLKKAPKWINVFLWALVAVRLLCPLFFESSLSLVPNAEPIPQEVFMVEPPENHESPVFDPIENPNLPDVPPVSVDRSTEQIRWKSVFATFGWMFGMGTMLVYATISYILVKRKVKASLHLRYNIWICDDIQTPFILGAIMPRIYIPSGTDEAQFPHIIAHENAHLKRRDHWWKPLGFLVLTIHWFNPLVWVAYILLCRDIELACDEKVIRKLNQGASIAYSEALLSCSVNRRMVMVCPLAFGEVGVKERVKRVLNYKRPAFWIIVVAVIVSVILAVCFLTNPKEKSTPEPIVNTLTESDVEWAQITVWEDEREHISLNESQIQELVGILIALDESDFVDSKVTEHDLSLMIYCDEKEILLKWDGEYVEFAFDWETAKTIDADFCSVNNDELNRFLAGFYEEESRVFQAEILEIHDGCYLVEPVEGSWELSSADRIEVPIRNAEPSPEPEAGDIIEIEYSGEILEIYPPVSGKAA